MNPHFNRFKNIITSPIQFKFFLLSKLPAAFFAGLSIQEFTTTKSVVRVKHSWFTQNPFRSMYFAVEAMAAEMASGMLVFGQVYKRQPAISMLVVKMEVDFVKKATGVILFTCDEGEKIQEQINQSIQDGEAKTFICTSTGKNELNETVAVFNITWSVKAKK
mgnify:FL=1|jgi:hypothetical protein